MTGFTPAERAALDHASVPAMRTGFAADVVTAATAGRAPLRRSSRGGWRRHGRVLFGVGALLVASATAAATGLLDRLPIRIPGITHVAAAPTPAGPKVAHAVRLRAKPAEEGAAVALAAPTPDPAPAPAIDWQRRQRRRAAMTAAGFPPALAQRPLVVRALAEEIGAAPGDGRAVTAEWRRLRALPPAERKTEIARIRTAFLGRHPRLAQQYEKRLESRSMAAASGNPPAVDSGSRPQAASPSPQVAANRAAWRQWRMARRAWRLRNNDAAPVVAAPDGPPPVQ
ncbi:hypothetical protein [Sphingomonas sp.]|jgi:hypothetical protein|uniref:hypothetical protein n=1 Tax=Sphingomonas sp. TaxID=28214 RepID=UPI002E300F71|nr:hypothetical protein [Sphingomonas sp.]HEX4694371.1 hypothetical protein [Sphingomonas sp.]